VRPMWFYPLPRKGQTFMRIWYQFRIWLLWNRQPKDMRCSEWEYRDHQWHIKYGEGFPRFYYISAEMEIEDMYYQHQLVRRGIKPPCSALFTV
jgi:hypothetical protein